VRRAIESRQVCELLTEDSKNLNTAAKEQTAEASPQLPNDAKGLIVKYMAYLEKEGYYKETSYPTLLIQIAKNGANLLDPESVKVAIARKNWKKSVKKLAVLAYNAFAKMQRISWDSPRYVPDESMPFVPDEKELDQLIAASRSRRMTAFLQTLKETYADPGEILRLQWIEISGDIITIKHPVKGHLAGQIKVSNKLVAMLNCLPKTSDRVFPTTYKSIYICLRTLRNSCAEKLQNPRLRSICFKSFRHWGGSMIAHYTNGNVLTVKKLLRHKRVENTMKYIHMIDFKENEFETTTATTAEEAKKALEQGFTYCMDKEGISLFRRPKRFTVCA
jgi:integrase